MNINKIMIMALSLCALTALLYSQSIKAEEGGYDVRNPEWDYGHDVRFGIFNTDKAVNEMKDLGINTTRVLIVRFDRAKENLAKGRSPGIEIVPTLVPCGGAWENDAIKELRDRGLFGQGGGAAYAVCGFPKDIEGYKRDLGLLIEKMDGDGIDDVEGLEHPIKAVQILNEPSVEWFGGLKTRDLAGINSLAKLKKWRKAHAEEVKRSMWEFIKISYETIKQKNPDIDIIVHFGAIKNGTPKGEMGKCAEYFDIADMHFYGNHIEFEEKLEKINRYKEEKRLYKAVWSCEMGGPDKRAPFSTPEDFKEHAEEVIKLHMVAFSNGLGRVYYVSLAPIGGFNTPRFHNLSLIDDNNKKRPAYYTYKILLEKAKGFSSIARLVPEKLYYKINFENKKPLYVLWDDNSEKILDMSRYARTPNVKITHIITERGKIDKDATIEIVPANNVKVGKTPIFVEEVW